MWWRIRCGTAVMTGSEDNGRVSSLLAPSVPGDQTQVTRLSDTHLYLHLWLAVYHAYVWYQRRPEKSIRYSETRRDDYQSPCRFWESDSAPLVELVSMAHRPLCTCIFL